MLRLEHIGIAVDDAQAMTRVLSEVLGRTPYKAEAVLSEGVRTLFLEAGGAKIELLEATSTESPIAGFLSKRGPGMHHLAFEVEDLDREIARLDGLGYQILGNARPGADGKRIVFLHPRGTGRVLIELCQQVDYPPRKAADLPAPRISIVIEGSPHSGALAHSLGRHFRVLESPAATTAGRVTVTGSADAPHVVVQDCKAGDLDLRITADGSGLATTLAPYLWNALPDRWGFLADLVAAHIRSA